MEEDPAYLGCSSPRIRAGLGKLSNVYVENACKKKHGFVLQHRTRVLLVERKKHPCLNTFTSMVPVNQLIFEYQAATQSHYVPSIILRPRAFSQSTRNLYRFILLKYSLLNANLTSLSRLAGLI